MTFLPHRHHLSSIPSPPSSSSLALSSRWSPASFSTHSPLLASPTPPVPLDSFPSYFPSSSSPISPPALLPFVVRFSVSIFLILLPDRPLPHTLPRQPCSLLPRYPSPPLLLFLIDLFYIHSPLPLPRFPFRTPLFQPPSSPSSHAQTYLLILILLFPLLFRSYPTHAPPLLFHILISFIPLVLTLHTQ